MPKVNVSLSQDILDELDKAARESKTNRSAFLAEAVKHYIEEKNEQAKREEMKEAAAAMDRIREEFGGWDGTAEVLKWRDLH